MLRRRGGIGVSAKAPAGIDDRDLAVARPTREIGGRPGRRLARKLHRLLHHTQQHAAARALQHRQVEAQDCEYTYIFALFPFPVIIR